ncbi:short chain dehydrogenase [Candidatus Berkiella aquae]|uniref:Short chain dehydrogenase n=1 Tax=Candidatus Berkiella aquae TaxID=295108 RepID=A0A0Q9YBA0_9GAMM|nr:short chain dehydrogenase [Candidatus Berkiella aquae]MCS5710626.1 short chain dehydrogenase [Candidatus Berkiella aquae]
MKIIIVGGTGTIGSAVVKALKTRHSLVIVGHQHGNFQVDITDMASIEKMYHAIGHFDALISTTGQLHFGPFEEMTPSDHMRGINSKLMGQINLVHAGLKQINNHGSFTLTSGILSDDPIRFGASASMINAALNGFVRGSAIEMPRGIRINIVSPTVITESLESYGDFFRGYEPVPADKVALAYCKSVEGLQTGQIYKSGW